MNQGDGNATAKEGWWPQRMHVVGVLALVFLAACGRKDSASGSAAATASSVSHGTESPPPGESSFGRPGEPIHLVVGYQPYYSEAWSGVVVNGLGLWKKYLPPNSTVDFNLGLQGAII